MVARKSCLYMSVWPKPKGHHTGVGLVFLFCQNSLSFRQWEAKTFKRFQSPGVSHFLSKLFSFVSDSAAYFIHFCTIKGWKLSLCLCAIIFFLYHNLYVQLKQRRLIKYLQYVREMDRRSLLYKAFSLCDWYSWTQVRESAFIATWRDDRFNEWKRLLCNTEVFHYINSQFCCWKILFLKTNHHFVNWMHYRLDCVTGN